MLYRPFGIPTVIPPLGSVIGLNVFEDEDCVVPFWLFGIVLSARRGVRKQSIPWVGPMSHT